MSFGDLLWSNSYANTILSGTFTLAFALFNAETADLMEGPMRLFGRILRNGVRQDPWTLV